MSSMMRLSIRVTLLALALLLLGTPVQAGTTIGVNTAVDELNSDGDCSLREAVRAANTDSPVDACPAGTGADTITLPAGTYTLTIAGTFENAAQTGDLDITEDLTINGAGAALSIIDGGAIDRVLEVRPGSVVTISGVTIQNGLSAISNSGTLTVADSSISDNTGSAIYNEGGALTLRNTVMDGNTSTDNGGAIYNRSGGTLTIADSTFTGNTGNIGGAINNFGVGAVLSIASSTFGGNLATRWGGAVANGGTMTVISSAFSDNIATEVGGGGIINSGDLVLDDTAFVGNAASGNGGAIYNLSGGTVNVAGSAFTGNTGIIGGAINNFGVGDVLSIASSTFDGNRSTRWGGAIAAGGLTLLTDTTITNNIAAEIGGGGIVNRGELTLTRTTISRNTGVFRGGGIWNSGTGAVLATNSTISLNRLTGSDSNARGGGIETDASASTTLLNTTVTGNTGIVGAGLNVSGALGSVVLQNSIIADNLSGTDCADVFGAAGSFTSDGHNVDSDGTCNLTGPTDLPNTDPILGPLQDNGGPTFTHALLPGSPAIDAGDDAACPGTDQRGVARPDGAACDIGAFELVQTITVAIDIKPGSDPNCFNSDGHGVIPVAILSSADFDATQVDPSTVSLNGQSVRVVGRGNTQAQIEDVNGDGLDDLVVKIEDADGTYEVGEGVATLTGETFDGTLIEGTDTICIVQ